MDDPKNHFFLVWFWTGASVVALGRLLVRILGFLALLRVPGWLGKSKSSLIVIFNLEEIVSSLSNDGELIPRSIIDRKLAEMPISSANSSCVKRRAKRKSRSRSPNLCRSEDTMLILSQQHYEMEVNHTVTYERSLRVVQDTFIL